MRGGAHDIKTRSPFKTGGLRQLGNDFNMPVEMRQPTGVGISIAQELFGLRAMTINRGDMQIKIIGRVRQTFFKP